MPFQVRSVKMRPIGAPQKPYLQQLIDGTYGVWKSLDPETRAEIASWFSSSSDEELTNNVAPNDSPNGVGRDEIERAYAEAAKARSRTPDLDGRGIEIADIVGYGDETGGQEAYDAYRAAKAEADKRNGAVGESVPKSVEPNLIPEGFDWDTDDEIRKAIEQRIDEGDSVNWGYLYG